jgi:23S rRNA (guanosine2251-2'-O)-methyltransferase
MDREIVVLAHNIRSAHNVGSLMRTCDGLGVKKLYLSGYSPYPTKNKDERMPHISKRVNNQISKTALGAEKYVDWQYCEKIEPITDNLKKDGYLMVGLEQSYKSIELGKFSAPNKVALIIGEEVNGIEQSLLKKCDSIVEIPMLGSKESFNVSVSAAIALYALRVY